MRKQKLEEKKLEEEKQQQPQPAQKKKPTKAKSDSDSSDSSSSSSSDDDDDAGNIITAENVMKKKSIAALSAQQVLKAAEEARKKEQLLNGSDDDGDDEDILVKKGSKPTKAAAVSDEDDDDAEESLTINKAYAKKYEEDKRKQTLSKKGSRGDVVSTLLREAANSGEVEFNSDDELVGDLAAKIRRRVAGEDDANEDGEDDESASSEDEDGLLLTRDVDRKIQETVAAIRAKKPEVYDPKAKFFTDEEMQAAREQAKTMKVNQPKTGLGVKQLLTQQMIANGGEVDSDDDSDADLDVRGRLAKLNAEKPRHMTYTEQQQKLKQDLLKQLSDADDDSDEDVFKVKSKSKPTDDGDSDEDEDGDMAMTPADAVPTGKRGKVEKSKYGVDGSSKSANDFLNSYLANEWWREKDLTKLPSYKDIRGEDLPPEVNPDEDEEDLDKTDIFEAAYNFRFEEPNAAYQIKSYPRPQLIGDSLRKDESKRKTQRDAAKEKKELEKLKKKEEIARLKAEKRKEVQKKMKELEEIAGLKSEATGKINLNDLLSNWDPSKHDEMMAQLFGEEEFYADAGEDEAMDEEELREVVLKGEDMSALGMGKVPGSESSGKSKKKKSLVPDAADAFQATSDAIKKTMDEYQDLETEGLVGQKTTFKWRQVEPNAFGMTIDEILALPDRELNAKVSLKKLATYREDGDADYVMPHKRKRDEKLARVNAKMAKRDAWKKAHSTPSNAAPTSTKKKETPSTSKPSSSSSSSSTSSSSSSSGNSASTSTPSKDSSLPLTAAQKRRMRKKKLEQQADGETQGKEKKQKTEQ